MRVLDLFCGAGGAAMGYHRAGFEVVGVDIDHQPDYPFTFVQADALKPPFRFEDFALVHASPPCQAFTTMGNRWRGDWPDLIDPIRQLIRHRPYVIENVPGAKSALVAPIRLTGEMFSIGVHRPRLFEANWNIPAPAATPAAQTDPVAVYGKPDGRRLWTRADGTELRAWTFDAGRQALGIEWVTDPARWHDVAEAIPPAYTEHIGRAFAGLPVDGQTAMVF